MSYFSNFFFEGGVVRKQSEDERAIRMSSVWSCSSMPSPSFRYLISGGL